MKEKFIIKINFAQFFGEKKADFELFTLTFKSELPLKTSLNSIVEYTRKNQIKKYIVYQKESQKKKLSQIKKDSLKCGVLNSVKIKNILYAFSFSKKEFGIKFIYFQ